MGSYDTAQLCLNGHLITDRASNIQLRQDFCEKCGAKTIMECQNCNSKIRGDYSVPGVISIGATYERPSNCYNCGIAYPWTKAIIEDANQLINAATNVSEEEQEKAKESFVDLLKETPRVEVALIQFKSFIQKAGSGISSAFREITVDVLSEAIKKSIWG